MAMRRLLSMACLLIVATMLGGCAMLQKIDGSSDKDIQKFRMSRAEQEEARKAEEAKRMAAQQDMQQKLIRELDAVKSELRANRERVEVLEKKTEEIASKPVMQQPQAPAQPTEYARTSPPQTPAYDAKALRIKVLTGNGKTASAKAMTERLAGLGYVVERVDRAMRDNFAITTVYYNRGMQQAGGDLAGKIGGKVEVKAMSWYSIFDLIVVTGP